MPPPGVICPPSTSVQVAIAVQLSVPGVKLVLAVTKPLVVIHIWPFANAAKIRSEFGWLVAAAIAMAETETPVPGFPPGLVKIGLIGHQSAAPWTDS